MHIKIFLNGTGYKLVGFSGIKEQMDALRKIIESKDLPIFVGEDVIIGNQCSISKGVKIGRGSVIGAEVRLKSNVEIGNFCNIGEHVEVGARSIVSSGSRIGELAKIGKDCFFAPATTIMRRTTAPDGHRIEQSGQRYSNFLPFLIGHRGGKKTGFKIFGEFLPKSYPVSISLDHPEPEKTDAKLKDEYELSPLTKNFLARIERIEETIKARRERIIGNFFGTAGLYQDFTDKGSEEMIESAINKIAEDFAKAKEFITEEDQKRIKDKLPIIKTPVIEDVTEDNLKDAVKAFGEWADNLNKQHLDYVREYWRKRVTPDAAPLTFQNLVTIIGALLEQRKLQGTEHETEVTKKLWNILEANFPKL